MSGEPLQAHIGQWRSHVERGRSLEPGDVDELEGHLRDRIDELRSAGLDDDEAFLVAVRRMGEVDALTGEFARVHSARMWKQLLPATPADASGRLGGSRREPIEAVLLASGAAAAIQILRLLATGPGEATGGGPAVWRNASLVVLPFLAALLLLRRRSGWRLAAVVAAPFAVAALAVDLFPFELDSATGLLVTLHLPVALWFAIGLAYTGAGWSSRERRMDFVRFTGEFVIYYVLIALGGGVLFGLSSFVLEPVSPGITDALAAWMLPSGAAGAVVIAGWLVEAKQSVIENIAPVLTAIFTPLFALMLAGAAVAYAATGFGGDFDRELLTGFDALLIVVLGLVLYGLSAREALRPAGAMDAVRLIAISGALVLDILVLATLGARIGDLGWTPNRVAALGLNLVLVANLAGAAWLSVLLLARRATPARLEAWQTGYLPVFGVWAALVCLALPPLFGFA